MASHAHHCSQYSRAFLVGIVLNLAMDAVPSGIDPGAVRRYLEGLPGVQAVHDLHT